MRMTVAALASVAFLSTGSLATADEAAGTIEQIDDGSRRILMQDGTIYSVNEGVRLEELQPGDTVLVVFDITSSGEKVITQVEPAS